MTTPATAPAFPYRGDQLYCEDVPLARLAAEHGTPLYVYSAGAITAAYRGFDAALEGVRHRICYSVKANSSLGVLGLLASLGAGADIVSGGELLRWQRAGGDPGKVVFSGVGKTTAEIEAALAAGIYAFNVESEEELATIDEVARAHGTRAPIALRVNPDVDPETHPYISTGLAKNKFGVAAAGAKAQLLAAAERAGIDVLGVDCHIGSQLTKTSPFADAIARLATLILDLERAGLRLRTLDIGGGLGIDYGQGDAPPPSPGEYGATVRAALAPLAHLDLEIVCEPGRAIVGAAGALLTRVVGRKRNGDKHFTIVDAAMNDLMRPALYGSYHPMWPVARAAADAARQVTDVVGPICETGDFLARDRELPALEVGAILAVGAAGAYAASMASNYNTRPRAAEILVDGAAAHVIRARETYDDLLRGEAPAPAG
ncbi:MAG: diaminopimelate decarboxylase [Kofleriaceae bacterium]